jgi:hypothetical protein
VLGGWIATRVGDRAMTFVGLLIAAYGYWLIHYWREDVMGHQYNVFGLFTLPAMHADLFVAGLGLGLVIGPLSSAALRVVPAAQHGIASASVVVARMTGMLIGLAALSAFGLYTFNQKLANLSASIPANATLFERVAAQATLYLRAFAEMYGSIFEITVGICVVGALLGLLLGGRKQHADEPEVAEQRAVAPTR